MWDAPVQIKDACGAGAGFRVKCEDIPGSSSRPESRTRCGWDASAQMGPEEGSYLRLIDFCITQL